MAKKLICILTISTLLLMGCKKEMCSLQLGHFLYTKSGRAIYYYRITPDSIFTLMIPNRYSTAHKYEMITCDSMSVFDVYADEKDTIRYPVFLYKLEYVNTDSIRMINLNLNRVFLVKRCSSFETSIYDKTLDSLIVPY